MFSVDRVKHNARNALCKLVVIYKDLIQSGLLKGLLNKALSMPWESKEKLVALFALAEHGGGKDGIRYEGLFVGSFSKVSILYCSIKFSVQHWIHLVYVEVEINYTPYPNPFEDVQKISLVPG